MILASAAFLALTAAVTTTKGYGHHGQSDNIGRSGGRVNYDYYCNAVGEEACLLNSINIYGPKVVLVNLDDRCQIEHVEREGIFIQEGDLIFVTGREHTFAW